LSVFRSKIKQQGALTMRRFSALLCFASSVALTGAPASARVSQTQELKELRQQVKMLMQRVEQMEAREREEKEAETVKQAETAAKKEAEVAAAPPADKIVTAGKEKGSWKIPGTDTTLKIGGFAKLDVITDIGTAHGEPFAKFASVPLDGSSLDRQDREVTMQAKHSRFNVTSVTPTAMGDVKGFLEGDFFGAVGNEKTSNGHSFELRHFYGEVAGLLAGQTWTTFFDVSTYPDTLDFVGPVGMTVSRQPQVRYTKTFGKASYAVALENPFSDFSDPTNPNTGSMLERSPDLIAIGKWENDYGHVSLAGLARELHVENYAANTDDSEFGWGLALASVVNTGHGANEKDDLRVRVAGGDGVGRYLFDNAVSGSSGAAGTSAGTNAAAYNGSVLEAQPSWGGYASYRHYWTDTLRSSLMGGYVHIDNDVAFLPALSAANRDIWSGHVNLFWQPADRFAAAVEYMHGERELEDGREGDLDRVMASFMYYL
jgi:hypothetical protein